MATSLNQMNPGQKARIVTVVTSGPISQRLHEMGLMEGAQLRMVRRAPMGDPLEIELQDFHLTLRSSEAALVEIELL